MDDYAGRVLADRYRLPLPPADADAYEPVETRAFDTYSGQEVLIRQVPLPEFVDAEVLDGSGGPAGPYGAAGAATRRPAEPVVRRAIEAAQAAAQVPDHPLLDQVFDVFAEAGSLWIVSERVAARPLAAFLAERPLNPYRAAEIGADVLTALRALHAHGWVHRNITSRTVLVCDDGRVVLTGLAVGAAEEALCGYAPVPEPADEFAPPAGETEEYEGGAYEPETYETEPYEAGASGPETYDPEVYEAETYEAEAYEAETREAEAYEAETREAEAYEYGAYEYGAGAHEGGEVRAPGPYYAPEPYAPEPASEWHAPAEEYGSEDFEGSEGFEAEAYEEAGEEPDGGEPPVAGAGPLGPYGSGPYGDVDPYARPAETQPLAVPPTADVRAARAGAIAAYRAGARAAARLGETGQLPVQRPAPPETPGPPPPPPTAPAAGAPEPQWWAQVADDEDDEDDGDEPYGGGPQAGPPPRVMLAGSWSDGPHASRDGSGPIPAGGGSLLPGSGRPALPAGYTAATPEPARLPAPAGPREEAPVAIPAQAYRGPTTRLAAERARQTRIAVVGAVTERWAPEQAGPVHENWRLAPPIGPATDLWALGALLYRAVQGHAPYPEDNAAELVQLVCAEPPAFAEECGPLRPVVESLLRQDPTERPDFEELRGWLRSLVRSAPEPEAGLGAVPPPSFDEARLPIVRRRGELVRRWRGRAGAGRHRTKRAKDVPPAALHEDPRGFEHGPEQDDGLGHGLGLGLGHDDGHGLGLGHDDGHDHDHDHGLGHDDEYGRARVQPDYREEFREDFREEFREEPREGARDGFREAFHEDFDEEIPQRAPRAPRAPRSSPRTSSSRAPGAPRSLGRTLLILVLLLLAGAAAYVVLFKPGGEQPRTPVATGPSATAKPTTEQPAEPTAKPTAKPTTEPTGKPATTPPPADPSAPALAAGYVLRQDPEGFRIGVPEGWRRSPINDVGQVRYTGGGFTLIVVPGRDGVQDNGSDPLEYQNSKERELEPYRSTSWSQVEKARRVDIGRTPTAEGTYTWPDSTGREVFVRNLALIDGGRYYVVQVIGPEGERDKVSEIYEQATKGFRPGR
ncbi:protein kinase [Streptomyces sp. NPDC004284]|uniref:protein kinase n=1 Tax=Streptomyces sp. NPDC004284 TaxID=3364695 RepID=UPI00369CFD13